MNQVALDPVLVDNTPNLSDPHQLINQLEAVAAGMEQQSRASDVRSALGGHPNPMYYYMHVSRVALAAASALRKHLPPPAPTPPPEAGPDQVETPQPAAPGAGKKK